MQLLVRRRNSSLHSIGAIFLFTVASLRAADKPVSFTADIQPVFENSCWKCHGGAVQLSKLDLRTREARLKGGERGAAIVPGKAEESRLYRVVAGLEKPAMPLDGKLTAAQISVDQGLDRPGRAVGRRRRPKPGQVSRPLNSPRSKTCRFPRKRASIGRFRKPVRAPVPAVSRNLTNPIDRFLEKARARQRPQGRAARRPDHAAAPRLYGPDRPAADSRRNRRVPRRPDPRTPGRI